MIFESIEIIGKSMGLQIPHLLYCDLSPHQNLSMKLDMHFNDTMNQYPSKFDSTSTKTG